MNQRLNLNRHYIIAFFLIVVTFILYLPTFSNDFINYDDPRYVTENPHVQTGLKPENILWSFKANVASNWHPLTWISHMIDCQLWGLNPKGHHLASLIFHILNTLLLFLVLRRMTQSDYKSAFVALLFAIHPLHVESVAWVAERKDVLSTFFWMLTMLAYSFYTEHPNFKRYSLVFLFLLLGLMSKPMLVTLPFVLLLLDYWPLKQPLKTNLITEKIPLFVLSLISSVITYYAQQSGGAVQLMKALPLSFRIANALVSYTHYISKMIWPHPLAVFYPHPGDTLPSYQIIGSIFLLILLSTLVLWRKHQSPYLVVGWSWYLGTLVPVIGLVQVGGQAMADRYTYIPLIGLFIFLSWGISDLVARWRYQRTLLTLSTVFIIPALMAKTWTQIGYWQNSQKLFEYALQVTKNNYLAHNNLGTVLAEQGKLDEALAHYQQALRLNPGDAEALNNIGVELSKKGKHEESLDYFYKVLEKSHYAEEVHNNLANSLLHLGKIDEAAEHYLKALKIKPYFAEAHNGLGLVLAKKGKYEEAIQHFSEALEIKPNYTDARANLGDVLAKKGQPEGQIEHLLEVLKINPNDALAHFDLANALVGAGKLEAAAQHYRETLRIQPNFASAHNNIGMVLAKQGRFDEAVKHLSEAIRINPDYGQAHNNLGNVLVDVGRKEEGIQHYREALRINPNSADSYYNLGNILAEMGQTEEAIKHYSEALRINPDHEDARNNLEIVRSRIKSAKPPTK